MVHRALQDSLVLRQGWSARNFLPYWSQAPFSQAAAQRGAAIEILNRVDGEAAAVERLLGEAATAAKDSVRAAPEPLLSGGT